MDLLTFQAKDLTKIEVNSLNQMIVDNTTKLAYWLTYSRVAVMKQETQYLINIHHGDEYIEWFFGSSVIWGEPYLESVILDELPTRRKIKVLNLPQSNLYFYFLDDVLQEFNVLDGKTTVREWLADITAKHCITRKQIGNP